MRHVIAVVVRAVVVLVAEEIAARVADIGMDPNGGANIGAGLLAFAAAILIAFVWSCVDAWRSRAGVVLLHWLVVAALVGVAAAWQAQGWTPRPDMGVLRSDLGDLGPFVGGLVAVPAVLGTGLGWLLGRHRRT